jgi:hypothetical protein
LPGVDSIFTAVNHTPQGPGLASPAGAVSTPAQCFPYAVAHMGRAADVQFTWGASGFSAVRDVTHNVAVPFARNPNASYGFMNTDANGNGVIDWEDFNYVNIAAQNNDILGFCGPGGVGSDYSASPIFLEQTPRLQAVNTNLIAPDGMTSNGQGFGLYVNGERYIFRLTGGTPPASGTVWTLRTYSGRVAVTSGGNTLDPSGYSFTSMLRPPTIPGLKFIFQTDTMAALVAGTEDITKVHTVPDPYYGASLFDLAPRSQKQLQFVNVPTGATIRIYSLSGVLVDVLNHTDTAGGGFLPWDLRNRSGQFVGSGVYFFHVSLPDGRKHIGRFTVINSGS